jgi:hypothetical protein
MSNIRGKIEQNNIVLLSKLNKIVLNIGYVMVQVNPGRFGSDSSPIQSRSRFFKAWIKASQANLPLNLNQKPVKLLRVY